MCTDKEGGVAQPGRLGRGRGSSPLLFPRSFFSSVGVMMKEKEEENKKK